MQPLEACRVTNSNLSPHQIIVGPIFSEEHCGKNGRDQDQCVWNSNMARFSPLLWNVITFILYEIYKIRKKKMVFFITVLALILASLPFCQSLSPSLWIQHYNNENIGHFGVSYMWHQSKRAAHPTTVFYWAADRQQSSAHHLNNTALKTRNKQSGWERQTGGFV